MFMRQLEYLVALAEEKHFAHAAEICCVSQPALSTAIRNLEAELGVPIVRRGKRYEGLTPEGERVLEYAKQTLASWKDMRREAATPQATSAIRIGVIPTALHVVAMLTESYQSTEVEMRQHVRSMSMEEIIAGLTKFEIDLGIGYLAEPCPAGMQCLPLYKEKFVLLAQKTSAVASCDSISWDDAARLPLCLLVSELQNRLLINTAFQLANVKPRVMVETNSPFALYTHVRTAGLYSIVPQSLGILSVFGGLDDIVAIPLTPSLDSVVGLLSLDRDPRSPMVEFAWKQAEALKIDENIASQADGKA
jgi:DNA-binding transcriptional LysR family regulator